MQEEQEMANAIVDAADQAPAGEKKRSPGRPKKARPVAPIKVQGIVGAPESPDDLLEMVYCNPMMFKKLLALYKAFEVSEVQMNFDPKGLKIVTRDHLGKSTVYAIIEGRCMNFYYCKQPLRICVKRDSLDKVIGNLGKNHYNITFILKEDYRSTMYIIIKDLEYNSDNSYEVDVVFKPEDNALAEMKDDDTEYPIKFKLSAKHFKNQINNIRKLSNVFTIQKCGADPLQFTFDKAHKVNWTSVYNDNSKISLESKIEPDDIFSVSVDIDYIKPFSNSNIGDEVFIAADKHEKMSFATFLDYKDMGNEVIATCQVKVYTEIKNYRRGVIDVAAAN
jgi:hypothetical protein